MKVLDKSETDEKYSYFKVGPDCVGVQCPNDWNCRMSDQCRNIYIEDILDVDGNCTMLKFT